MAIQRKRKVTRMYQIEVNYKEDQLSAEFHCPLCDKDWRYPFTIREIYGHLRRAEPDRHTPSIWLWRRSTTLSRIRLQCAHTASVSAAAMNCLSETARCF